MTKQEECIAACRQGIAMKYAFESLFWEECVVWISKKDGDFIIDLDLSGRYIVYDMGGE
jgi:hypothetical protein